MSAISFRFFIELSTSIRAPRERVFDLARSIDAHRHTTGGTEERAVAGVTSGLIALDDEVTWEARHFGVRQRLRVRVTAFDRPKHFLRICADLAAAFQISAKSLEELKPNERIFKLLGMLPPSSRTCLVFDEIEFISPLAQLDPHWKQDFLPFWQTLWAAQSQFRRMSVIVVGVNPTVTEMDVINNVQNPMFGIVRPSYLRGFEKPELRSMIRNFGKRMGMRFSEEALNYLHDRYGGHPLLTRMACSYVHTEVKLRKLDRPRDVPLSFLKDP